MEKKIVSDYRVVKGKDGRYVITDAATQEVIDNANGYGYKTRQNAEKAAWYKFKGGKAKKDAEKGRAFAFWREHPDFAETVRESYQTWIKEIARGEVDADAGFEQLAREMGVEGFQKAYLDYLPC